MIFNTVIVSKVITLLAQTTSFKEDIIEGRQQTTNIKKWAPFKMFFTNPTVNKGERSPPEAKGDTQRQYKTYTLYGQPLQKSITRQ